MTAQSEPRNSHQTGKLVYVVDDQEAALQAIVILIRSLGPEWKVVAFSNPLEALAACKRLAPDLVLSDFSMPQMMGADLLDQVRAVAPSALRMVMSGWVDLNKLSQITSAHQYFAKPFDSLRFKALVQRSFAARAAIQDAGLHQLVVSLRSLPSLPHVYHTLLAQLGDEGGSSQAIAALIAQDPGLSTKLLHLANSPLFGRGSAVSDPFDAVFCLGTELIKAVVLSQELLKHYASLRHAEIDVSRVWSHSWDVAELAQYICLQMKASRALSEEAFLAGLLHEVGTVILVDNFPQEFQRACQAAREKQSPIVPEVLATFHASPGQVGAYLLKLWGMPDRVVDGVANHEHPEAEPSREFSISAALYIAKQISMRKSPPYEFPAPEWNIEYLQALGCWDQIQTWQ